MLDEEKNHYNCNIAAKTLQPTLNNTSAVHKNKDIWKYCTGYQKREWKFKRKITLNT